MRTPFSHRIYLFLASWCELFDGIAGILTLGLFKTNFAMRYCAYHSKRTMQKFINERNEARRKLYGTATYARSTRRSARRRKKESD